MKTVKPDFVVSSTIQAVGYRLGSLFVRFNSGGCYKYDDVPYPVFDDLKKADSVGSCFHKTIRNKFAFTKLDRDPFAAV